MLQGLAMSLAECCAGGVLSHLSHDQEMAQTRNAQSGKAGCLGTWSQSPQHAEEKKGAVQSQELLGAVGNCM